MSGLSGRGPGGPQRKKACPGKSRPLLTYEKHQVQISLFQSLPIKFIRSTGKISRSLSGRRPLRRSGGWRARGIRPLLHLSALYFPLDEGVEVFFSPEEFIDLGRRYRLQKFNAIFFSDIENGFFQCYLVPIALGPVVDMNLPHLGSITVIDRPEFLGFFGRQLQPSGNEACFHRFQSTRSGLLRKTL